MARMEIYADMMTDPVHDAYLYLYVFVRHGISLLGCRSRPIRHKSCDGILGRVSCTELRETACSFHVLSFIKVL